MSVNSKIEWTDATWNSVSLFNVVEDIQPLHSGAAGQPLAQMVAVSSWNREPGDEDVDFQMILRIHPPGAEPRDFPMNFRMVGPRQRLTLRMQGAPPLAPGLLRFELLLNGKHIAEHSITVHPMKVADERSATNAPAKHGA